MATQFDIQVDAETAEGDRIGLVLARHEPRDAAKLVRIREAMMRGESIRPVLLAAAGDHHIALSGTHRLAAAMGLDGALSAVMLPELSAAEWDEIGYCNDDDDLLAALREIAESRDDMSEAVAAMEAEVAANAEA